MFRRSRVAIFVLSFFVFIPASGAPRFSRIFSDHAVLQRDKAIEIWGFDANPGATIQIQFGKETFPVMVEAGGSWKATIPATPADANGRDLTLLENDIPVETIKDVVIGDIWLAAGQSNMQFRVANMLKGLPETQPWIEKADQSEIRFRRINDPVSSDRRDEAKDLAPDGNWIPMNPESILQFSAVAAVFAREIQSKSNVPVGIIDVSWGGKPIEPFIPRESLSTNHLKQILNLADRNNLEKLATIRGGVIIRNPEGHPGTIFNARIAPISSFALAGFIWYQAESNAGRGEDPREYSGKMKALASGWRNRWNDEKLPFYYVQLPSFPPASGWIRVREEQRRALDLIPNSGMVVTIDIPGDDIHPPDKISVGRRLARLVLTGESGPLYKAHEIHGQSVQVHFSNSKGGLFAGEKQGISLPEKTPNNDLSWFELAGNDGIWYPAEATIHNDTVIVTSTEVRKPVAVRYACHTKPQGKNLYNRAGLPASPFCSNLDMLPWVDQPPKK